MADAPMPILENINPTETTLTFSFSITFDNNISSDLSPIFVITVKNTGNGEIKYQDTHSYENGIVYDMTITGLSKGLSYILIVSFQTNYGTENNTDCYFYTHPGRFEMGAIAAEPITNVLNQTKISAWIEHLEAAIRWYNCKGSMDDSNDVEVNTNNLYVYPGYTITASWYRDCLRALNAIRDSEYQFKEDFIDSIVGLEESKTNGKTPTIITADLINKLNFSGIESATS